MSLEDKAGQLFHSQIGMGPGGTLADADPAFGLPSTETLVLGASPQGRLPFDLLSSTRSVEESRSDVPFDTADPLFRFGDGTSFRG
jgi:hypothetical protein